MPAGSRQAIRQIDQAGNDAPIRYTYFGDEGQVIERRTLRTDYDPRKRPWYLEAMAAGRTVISEPFLFTDSQDTVITVSRPVVRSGVVVGVVAAHLTLGRLGDFLAR